MAVDSKNGKRPEAQFMDMGNTLAQMEEVRAFLASRNIAVAEPVVKPQPIPTPAGPEEEPPEPQTFEWKRKQAQSKTTVVRCIVIDKKSRWHKNVPVDLHGANMTGCTWGYYGNYFPVLVEKEKGQLEPWHLPDQVGENSNKLYKAANPENYKNVMELHNTNTLQKIQIGLMVVVVLGLFFLMYVLLNQ